MSINKIMIVEDSTTELMNLKAIVAKTGVAVITATSGKEAIEKAAKELPGLIFMDVVMDDIDGFKACREIANDPRTKDIPIVFVTSKNQKADRIWAEMQGGRGLIAKPYRDEDILDQIRVYN